MLDGLTPDLAPRLVLAIGGVGIALVILVLVLIFLKRRNSPLFIKGGKGREARLMVLDAAAVDPKRRLVLIRRDDVEHLIMIGGPTDIVIESGIIDRAQAAPSARSLPVEDVVAQRPVAAPVTETRQTQPIAERKPEPVRSPAPTQPEKPAAAPVEVRAVTPSVQPVVTPVAPPAARPVTPPAAVTERSVPTPDRYMERPAAERQPEPRTVSAMGSVLYGEDREPMTGAKSILPSSEAQATAAAPRRVEPQVQPVIQAQPVIQPQTSLPSAAEAVLDAARDRVLPNQQQTASAIPAVTVDDAERALAARMEAMRRVQLAQPAAQATPSTVQQPVFQPVTQRAEPQLETPKAKDAEPSDFEKLLEAELDANGVFGKQSPQVRSDSRVTNAVAASDIVPPVRVTPPVTGATPDVSSEEEVARLLGEIAINRKP